MSKDIEKFDDFDFDDFDSGSGFDDPFKPKSNRQAIQDIPKNFLAGFKDTTLSSGMLRDVMVKALPKGYGDALDVTDGFVTEGMNAYREVERELGPAIKGFKKAVKRAKPLVDPLIPKAISDKLDKLLQTDEDAAKAQIDATEAAISTGLAEIFGAQEEAQAARDKETEARETTREVMADKRASSQQETLNTIATGISHLVGYQNNIGVKFQRKSLELQYRQYYIARDQFELLKRQSSEHTSLLRSITQNTALPEIQKMEKSEQMKQAFSERLFGSMAQKFSDYTRGFRKEMTNNIVGNLKRKGLEAAEAFRQGAMGIDMAAQGIEMADGMGINQTDLVAQGVGGGAARWLGQKAAAPVRWGIREFGLEDKVKKGDRKLRYLMENDAGVLDAWSRTTTEESNIPGWTALQNLIKASIPRHSGVEQLAGNDPDSLGKPSIFTNMAHTSVVDVIPGLLSKLLQSTESIRTYGIGPFPGGAPQVDSLRYDYKKGELVASRELTRRIRKAAVGESDLGTFDRRTDDILTELLKGSNVEFSPEERQRLKVELVKRAEREKVFNPSKYLDSSTYGSGVDPQTARKFGDLMQSAFKLDAKGKVGAFEDTEEKEISINRLFKDLKYAYPSMGKEANFYANTGARDLVLGSGLTRREGKSDVIDSGILQRRFEAFLKGVPYDEEMGAVTEVQSDRTVVPNVTGLGGRFYADRRDRVSDTPTSFSGMGVRTTSANAPYSADVESSGLLETAIRESSSKPEATHQIELLEELLQLIRDLPHGFSGGGGSGSGGGQSTGRLKRWGKGLGSGIWKGVKGLYNAGAWTRNKLVGGAVGAAKWGWGKLTGKDTAEDVFLPGQADPVLSKWKMLAGEYFNAGSDIAIKTFADIKGRIIDKDGNTVLSMEDAKRAVLKNGKSLLGSLSSAFNTLIKNPVLGLMGVGTSIVRAQFKALGNVAKKAWRWNLSNTDICVKGEEPQVRLYANLMRKGYYHDAKDISRTIWSFKDIAGAVVDNDGNTVLSAEDLNKGLVTPDGRPLKTTSQKLWGAAKHVLGMGRRAVSKAWQKTKDAASWVGDKAKSGWEWVKGKAKGVKLPDGVLNNSFNGQLGVGLGLNNDLAQRQVGVLVRIHNLLIRGFGFDDTPLDAESLSTSGVGIAGSFGKALGFGKEALAGAQQKAKDAIARAKQSVMSMDKNALVSDVTEKLKSLGVPESLINKVKAVKFPTLKRGLPASEYDDPSTFGNKTSGKNRAKLSQWQQHFMRKAEALKNDGDGLTLTDLKSLTVDKAKSLKDKVKDRWASEGERENSFLDIIKDRKDRLKNSAKGLFSKKGEKAEKGSGWIGKLMGLVGGISLGFGKLLSFGGGLMDSVKSIRNAVLAMQAAKGVADLAGGVDIDGPDGKGKKGAPKKPVGKLGKAWNATKAAGKWTGKAAWNIAKYGAVKPLGWALRGGVALAGLGLSGALAVLTSPVVLAGGAVALAGYGAYKGYRYLKGELKPLERLRAAEYGVDPDDLSDWEQIRELEEKLKPHLKLSPGKPAELDPKLPYSELFGIFGIELEESDREKALIWADWFQYRFKPVFLTHITVLNQIQPGVLLADIDTKLVDSLKVPFVNKVVFSVDSVPYPYTISADPWGKNNSQMGRKQIDIEVAAIEKEFGEAAQKEKALKKIEGTRSSAGSLGFVAGMREGMPAVGGVGSAVGVAPAQLKRRAGLLQTKSLATKYVAQSQATGAPLLKTSDTLNASFAGGRQRTLDDFAAVRLKTYGLVDLDVEKVNAILALESEVLEQVLVTPQGKATLYKDPAHYFTLYASHFGVNPADNESKEQWMYWFAYRFTPVVLNYVAAVKKIDKNLSLSDAWRKLSKQALYDTAIAISGTQVSIVDKLSSVWTVYANPFPQYAVNENPKSIESHLAALKADVGKTVYQTPGGKILVQKANGKGREYNTTYSATGGTPDVFKPGNISKLGSSSIGAGVLQNSSPMIPFTAGSGAGYDQLPNPKGNGSLDAYRDLLTAAAQAAGIDPSMLFTMARLESSFNTNARASSSSAAGLFQFLASTWREQLDKHGAAYGIPPGTQATDPKAAALMAAEYIKANRQALESKIGRQANATDLYAAHFLGAGGAAKLLTSQPMQSAAQVFPAAAKSNPAIFYEGTRPRSIGEVIAVLDKKVGTPYNPKPNPINDTPEIPVLAGVNSEGPGLAQVAIGEVAPNARPDKMGGRNISLLDQAAKGVVGTRKANLVQVAPSAAKGGFNSATAPKDAATKQLSSVKALQKADEQKSATAVEQSKAATAKTQQHVKTATDLLAESLQVQKSMDTTLSSIDKRIEKMVAFLLDKSNEPRVVPAQGLQTAAQQRETRPAPNAVVSTKRNV